MIAGFRSRALALGAFVLGVLLLLYLLFNTMANGVPGTTREFSASFTNVSGLTTGDDVRVAGVRVGRVSFIKVRHGRAAVGFSLETDQPLLSNTHMVMRYQNLLGQRYLALVQPRRRGQPLPAGSHIPTARTSPGFDLTALLNGFRPLLQTLRPADVNKLATEVVHVLQGEGGTVSQLLDQTTTLTNFVADRDHVIDQVLTNLTPVLEDLARQGPALRRTVQRLKDLMTGLARDRTAIGGSIARLSGLMTSTSHLLARARHPLTLDTHVLRQVARAVAGNRRLLIAALDAFGAAFGDLGRATSYGSALNVFMCTMWLKGPGVPQLNLSGHPHGGPFEGACAK